MQKKKDIARKLIKLRQSLLILNEKIKNKEFKIPIHLSMGHEAIALAVNANLDPNDYLALSHRNSHYNLARMDSLKPILEEYQLKPEGLGQGEYGSMNLANPEKNIVYTSSILGNNLAVATGLALSQKMKQTDGITFVVTGDGAMEEGSFYEAIEVMSSNKTPAIIIIENNNWSLASRVSERRCEIKTNKVCQAFGADYIELKGNCVFDYIEKLSTVKQTVLREKRVACVDVELDTLGGWYVDDPTKPEGKRYINYHAGGAAETTLHNGPILQEDDADPLYVLQNQLTKSEVEDLSSEVLQELMEEIEEELV